MKKAISFLLSVIMLFSGIPIITILNVNAATFNDINKDEVFLKQAPSECTITAATSMIRRVSILRGDSKWSTITVAKAKSVGWINDQGLRGTFTYSDSGNSIASISVTTTSLPGGSSNKSTLINLLSAHPEGVVIYNGAHAILLTDYTGGVFYCNDPSTSRPAGRIAISQAYSVTIDNATKYWYVSSPKVSVTSTTDTYATITEGNYNIVSTANIEKKYLAIARGEDVNSTEINGWTRTNHVLDQFIKIQKTTDGYKLLPQCSTTGKVVNVATTAATSGSNVNLYQDNKTSNQWWKFVKVGSAYKIVSSANPSVCMTIDTASTGWYNISVQTYTGASNQLWNLVPKAIITYDVNGGTGSLASQIVDKDVSEQLVRSGTVTRDGYFLKGLALSADATKPVTEFSGYYTAEKDTTLYCFWLKTFLILISDDYEFEEEDVKTFSVDSVNTGGRGLAEATIYTSEKYSKTNTNQWGREVAVSSTGEVDAIREYRDTNGLSVPSGGFVFSFQVFNEAFSYFDFIKNAKKITFNSSDNTVTVISKKSKIVWANPDGSFTFPEYYFKNEGKTVSKWVQSGTDYSVLPGHKEKFTSYQIFKAEYVDTYPVTYNANGGTGAPSSQTKTYGTNLTLSSTKPTKTGYTFKNWNTKSDGTGTSYSAGASYTANAALTLYAQWTPNTGTAYKVNHYQMNVSGSGYTLKETDSKTGTTASSVTIANLKKTYTGFTYEGGKGATAGTTTKPSTLDTTTTILADGTRVINIYYSRNRYALTLSKGTGISAVSGAGTYYYGQSVSIDATPSTGYTWSKWSDENTTKSRTYTMPAAATTLTATATATKYTVTFNANGGTCSTSSKTVTFDSTYGTLPTPTKTNCAFDGWFTSASGGTQITSSTKVSVTSNQTLYAHWTVVHTHSYTSSITKKATCTTDGIKTFTCSCGDSYTETIKATGHRNTVKITEKKATCLEKGSEDEYCLDCSQLIATHEIPALGHDYVLKYKNSSHPHNEEYICSRCKDKKIVNEIYSEACPECNFTSADIDTGSCKITGYTGSLNTITIPAKLGGKKVVSTNTGSLRANTTVTEVKIENGVTEIGSLTFMNCNNLKKAVIPESVTNIGSMAFYGCASDFKIYCFRNSKAHEYAVNNSIDFVILDIAETENSVIDYENKLIFTGERNITAVTLLINMPSTTVAVPQASLTNGKTERFGTGSTVTVFENNVFTGDYKVIVTGDLDGDSVCDVIDASLAEKAANNKTTLSREQICAANGCYSEEVDITAYQNVVNRALA